MAGGHTTLIQRVLDRRAAKPPASDDGTTATVAVMMRVLPPPKALFVFQDSMLCQHTERRIMPDVLDFEATEDEEEALHRLEADFFPVVLSDNAEFVRKLRARQSMRAPFVLYVVAAADPMDRAKGLLAGADECVERRVTDEEFNARLRGARRIAELELVLRYTMAENRKLSATDELTQVASRRFFNRNFPQEVERAARSKLALSLIMCDIDFFKKINDRLGHPAGDQILQQFTARLQQLLRARVDWVSRLGGEEFAVVLPETVYSAALDVARKLRDGVGDTAFEVNGKPVWVTASFGVCGMDSVPLGQRRLADRMLKIADETLYRSKEDGRNRVTATKLKVAEKQER
jgi:two-component system, cell cycle response regulator